MSRVFHAIKVAAVPLLFAAASLGLAAINISLQRKAEHARAHAAQTAAMQDAGVAEKLAGAKLKDLAPAAKNGDISAEVEMARRLALGEGVKKNEAEAAIYFQAVINQLGEINARDKRGPLAATAFRFLAQFHQHGLPAANIAANPSYAFDLLHHAASYFGDPVAQYELARLLINGDGVTKNTRVGAQWLLRATLKGYAPAQALLGDMLWRGNGVKRKPGEGLGLLAIARRNAAPADKAWISEMFETVRAEALPTEILEANAFIVQESGASPFSASAGLIEAGTQEGAGAPAKAPPGKGAGASYLLRGANPAFFGLDSSGRGPGVAKGDPKSAGIIQMYRPAQPETSGDNGAPMRVAGVTK